MAGANVRYRAVDIGVPGRAAGWVSAACCLPYLVLKVVWAVGLPVGVTDRSVLHDSRSVAANTVMAVIQLAGLLLVLALTRPWARRAPVWLLLFPVWVGTGLLFDVVVGIVLTGLFSFTPQGSGTDAGEFQPWVFVLVYASFAVQGIALAVAFTCHVRSRWGGLLGGSTDEVLARRAAQKRSWPATHLAGSARVVAGGAVAMAAVLGFWAAGGSVGPADEQSRPLPAIAATGAVAAVMVAVGLLGLAGGWRRQTRFLLPVALTWVGSGGLVAFDGLNYTLILSSLVFGAADSGSSWSLTDTLLMTKVVIGAAAAVVGVATIAAVTANSGEAAGPAEAHDSSTP